MTHLLLVTVPFTPASPSPSSLFQTDDGQFVIVTRTELNIFTPSLGIQVDKLSRVAPTKKGKERVRSDIPLFRTSFLIEKKDTLDWSAWTNDTRTTAGAAGLNEPQWRAATVSPSGVGQLGGCVLAGLTSNHEVLIYEPLKNAHKGSWPEAFDLTAHLVRLFLPLADDGESYPIEGLQQLRMELSAMVYQLQSTSISWSPSVPGTASDFSLLSVGHKSGHTSLWRRLSNGTMSLLLRERVDSTASWISLLAWSPWIVHTRQEDRKFAASLLAIADALGSIWVVEVEQDVTSERKLSPAAKDRGKGKEGEEEMEEEEEEEGEKEPVPTTSTPLLVTRPDGRTATQFCWVVTEAGEPQLVYTKLGTVEEVTLQRVPSEPYTVSSSSCFDLPETGALPWEGATPYASCSGIIFDPLTRILTLTLSSSSFYAFSLFGPSLTLLQPTTATLTTTARSLFVNASAANTEEIRTVERIVPSYRTGERVLGFAKVKGLEGDVCWLSELDDPNRIAYLNNSLARTSLVVAHLNDETLDLIDDDSSDDPQSSAQLLLLQATFASPSNSRLEAPLSHLRGSLHFLADHARDDVFISHVLDSLSIAPPLPAEDAEMPGVGGEGTQAVVAQFVGKLYGDAYVEQLRMRETVARFVVRHQHTSATLLPRARAIQSSLARQLAHELSTQLGALLSRSSPLLIDTESAILGRLLLASAALQPAPPTDLELECTIPDRSRDELLCAGSHHLESFGGDLFFTYVLDLQRRRAPLHFRIIHPCALVKFLVRHRCDFGQLVAVAPELELERGVACCVQLLGVRLELAGVELAGVELAGFEPGYDYDYLISGRCDTHARNFQLPLDCSFSSTEFECYYSSGTPPCLDNYKLCYYSNVDGTFISNVDPNGDFDPDTNCPSSGRCFINGKLLGDQSDLASSTSLVTYSCPNSYFSSDYYLCTNWIDYSGSQCLQYFGVNVQHAGVKPGYHHLVKRSRDDIRLAGRVEHLGVHLELADGSLFGTHCPISTC
ncbi:hypothetical protein RQP46_006372 [Phenoliferia psychrophenolica]